jgi:hypothetical protein
MDFVELGFGGGAENLKEFRAFDIRDFMIFI